MEPEGYRKIKIEGLIGVYFNGIKIGDCDSFIYTFGLTNDELDMTDDELIDLHETKRILNYME